MPRAKTIWETRCCFWLCFPIALPLAIVIALTYLLHDLKVDLDLMFLIFIYDYLPVYLDVIARFGGFLNLQIN